MEKTRPFPSVVAICVELDVAFVIFTLPVPSGAKVISPFEPSVRVTVPALVPPFVFKIKSEAPPVVKVRVPAPLELIVAAAPESPTVKVSADATTSPVPFGVKVMFPLEPSVMVMLPEFVPELVSNIKSCAPLDVTVAFPDPVPTLISPDPFGIRAKSIFVSPPVADIDGAFPVAAFVISNWFTADAVV